MTSVAVVGVGMLGAPVAAALAGAGRNVWVYDRDPDRSRSVPGTRTERTLDEVASRVEVLVSCVDGPNAALDVALGPTRTGGAIAAVRPGAVYVEMATMSIAAVVAESDACAAGGVGFVECPVSGRPPHLTALVGGHDSAVAEALRVLDPVIDRTFRFHTVGHGVVAKLVNQFLTYGNLMLAAQGTALGTAFGIDAELLVEALGACAASSKSLDLYRDVLANGSEGYGTVRSIERDLDLYAELAVSHAHTSAAFTELRALFQLATERGIADEPFPNVFDLNGRSVL